MQNSALYDHKYFIFSVYSAHPCVMPCVHCHRDFKYITSIWRGNGVSAVSAVPVTQEPGRQVSPQVWRRYRESSKYYRITSSFLTPTFVKFECL